VRLVRRGCATLQTIVLCLLVSSAHGESASADSLKGAVDGLFRLGVAVRDRIAERPADWPLIEAQFNSVTAENCLKPDPVQTAEGQFNFSAADALVDFAAARHLQMCGHCLVWAKDDRTPAWFFRDGQQETGCELLLSRMKNHIDTVVGRYRGRIAMWDVVNEALDDGTDFLRPSGWSRACGEEFIAKAFEFAHAADLDALLVYNDELPAKRAKLVRLVRSLKAQHVPFHAVGLQGHYEIDRVPLAELETTLDEMHKLGVKVVVSELDMDVIPRGRWWAEAGKYRDELSKLDPYRDGCPAEVLKRQAEARELSALVRSPRRAETGVFLRDQGAQIVEPVREPPAARSGGMN
jgi:endo-1,4-beta-xylanase